MLTRGQIDYIRIIIYSYISNITTNFMWNLIFLILFQALYRFINRAVSLETDVICCGNFTLDETWYRTCQYTMDIDVGTKLNNKM